MLIRTLARPARPRRWASIERAANDKMERGQRARARGEGQMATRAQIQIRKRGFVSEYANESRRLAKLAPKQTFQRRPPDCVPARVRKWSLAA